MYSKSDWETNAGHPWSAMHDKHLKHCKIDTAALKKFRVK